jgi:hypothetical protein
MDIFKSASKLVFVLLAIALVVLTFTGKVESTEFTKLAGFAFVYYFTRNKAVK